MIISKVSLDNLRPIHQDSTEITKKYKQIKNLLNDGSHSLFAEPEYITSTEIKWKSNLDGDLIQYTNADEETQGIIRIQLKKQFNEIYNNSKIKDQEEIKQYIDSIFEVPKLDSIYMINDHIVIDNWGYIEDNYNAERDIIKKLIDGVLFSVNIEDENGIAVENLPIKIKYGKDLKEYKTDENGNVLIDVIYGNSLDIEIDLKGNDKYKDDLVTKKVICLRDKTELTIKLPLFIPPIPIDPIEPEDVKELSWFEKNKKLLLILFAILLLIIAFIIVMLNSNMKPVKKTESINKVIAQSIIIVYDKDTNKVINNAEVKINYDINNQNTVKIYKTDINGKIEIKNINFNSKVTIQTTANNYIEDKVVFSNQKLSYKIYLKKIGFKVALKSKGKNKIVNGEQILENNGILENTQSAYQYNLNKPTKLKKLYLKEYDGDYSGKNFIQFVLIDENMNFITLNERFIPSGDNESKEHYVDLSSYNIKVKSIIVKPINNQGKIEELGGEWQVQKLIVE